MRGSHLALVLLLAASLPASADYRFQQKVFKSDPEAVVASGDKLIGCHLGDHSFLHHNPGDQCD